MKLAKTIGGQSWTGQLYRSTPESSGFVCDVFVIFRGLDTRPGFVSHLISSLQMKGVRTFVDEEDLQRGEHVKEVLWAIEASRLFVVVLSKGCADFGLHLMELTKIVQTGRLILPVFCDVQPSDVRHQVGPFEAAFGRYELNNNAKTVVEEWRDALRQLGSMSGFYLTLSEGGRQDKMVQVIVERILRELSPGPLLPKYLVGIASRLVHMLELLDIEAEDVRIFGIVGMGGLGKTTLAKAVFNAISYNYHASSFIPNVRELSREYNGLVGLQRHLVHDILKHESEHISDVSEGISIIKRAVQGKRVLIVLDDVDDIQQLQALACRREWFTVGSRIIITTRDEHVLNVSSVREHEIYRLGVLNSNEALQLFCYHAFRQPEPPEDYMLLCKVIASKSGGLPWLLLVLASLFSDLKSVEEWKVMLEKLNESADSSLFERLMGTEKIIGLSLSKENFRESKGYSSDSFPDEVDPQNLAILDLSNSKIRELSSNKVCTNMMSLPDSIGRLISLTDLVLDFTLIKEIPHSVASLRNFQRLSLIGCLKELHDSVREMDWFESLEGKILMADSKTNPPTDSAVSSSSFSQKRSQEKRRIFSKKSISEPEIPTFSSSLQEFSEKEVSEPEMTTFSSSLQEPLKHPQVSKLDASSSHLPKQFKYDVYLSFKREDAGNAFAINLSRALEQHGVAAFLDNGTLSKKDKYSDLLGAIENSNVAIPILTDSYFRSWWCLLEIANAVECCRMILPVFIDHDPIHIKEQSGPLALVFQYHKENAPPEELDRWREALSEVGDASGYHLQHDADGDEFRLVQLVVKRVLSILNRTQRHPFPYTIGMKTRIDHCLKLLDIESGDVRMVGIVGVGGIGKTTLAKALFSRISNCYEASCFISNWRTKAMEQPNALVSLQNELIRGIFKDKVKPVNDVDEGMDVIRSEIQSKILLLVLDDADQINLMSAWAGERYSFHPGSRIIIVCRDVEILRKNKVYEREIYQLQKLSEDESVELFNFYAFGRDKPNEQYQKISKRIASSVGGLPLNLKVFGSFFSDLRNMSKWEEVLEKLTSPGTAQEISNQSTNLGQNVRPVAEQASGSSSSPSRDRESRQQNLETPMRPSMAPDSSSNRDANTGRTLDPTGGRTSDRDYDSNPNPDVPDRLQEIVDNLDATAREIFLDIACFFIGMNRENVMHIWRGCEFSGGTTPEDAIQKLLSVELLSINIKDDTFDMHEKIKKMGRELVEREDEELGRRSRLWEHENSMHVLNNRRATDRIQGIHLNLANTRLRTTALSPMSKLRLICVDDANFVGGFKGLAVEPRWVKWQSTDASSSFPHDFNLHKVAVLDISKSSLNNVGGQKRFPKSKAMKWMKSLICGSSAERAMKWMKSLICGSSAKKDYENLKVLELNSSENQTAFPDLSNFPCLVKLTLDGCCRLAEVRTSIERHHGLTCLKIRNCSILQSLPANFSSLVSLKILDLSGCSRLSDLPGEVGNLQSLMELLLSGTAVQVIPESINQLRKLERLLLDNCEALTKLPGSLEGLKSLQVLSAKSCTLLATVPTSIGNVSHLTHLLLDGTMIKELPNAVGELENLSHLLLDGTMIEELPDTVGKLENLSQCSVCRCKNLRRLPASMGRLRYLKHLDLSATGIREFPVDFGALSSLTELQMSNCKEIKVLPESFSNLRILSSLDLRSNTNLTSIPSLRGLSELKQLNVVNCENLKTIPQLPNSLTKLLCYGCTALETLEDVSNLENLIELNLTGCTRLIEINGIDSLAALRRFHMSGCKRLSNAFRNQLDQNILEHLESFSIPGSGIPRVFTNRQLSYEVPVSLDVGEGMELLICLVVAVQEQAGCWEPNIKVETEAEGEKIVKLPGVALPSKDDNLCLWHYKEADRVFPRGNVKITLLHHEWIKDEVRNGGLCEPGREVEAANEDGLQVSVFECIARCCRRSNTA